MLDVHAQTIRNQNYQKPLPVRFALKLADLSWTFVIPMLIAAVVLIGFGWFAANFPHFTLGMFCGTFIGVTVCGMMRN